MLARLAASIASDRDSLFQLGPVHRRGPSHARKFISSRARSKEQNGPHKTAVRCLAAAQQDAQGGPRRFISYLQQGVARSLGPASVRRGGKRLLPFIAWRAPSVQRPGVPGSFLSPAGNVLGWRTHPPGRISSCSESRFLLSLIIFENGQEGHDKWSQMLLCLFFSTGQAAVFIYEKETNKKYFQLEWNLAIKVAVAHFLPFRPRIYVRYFGIFTQRKDSPRALLRMGIYTRRGLLRSVSQDLNRRGNLYRRDLECRCHSPLKFETNNFQVEA